MALESQASHVDVCLASLGFRPRTMSSRTRVSAARASPAPQAPERADGARGDSLGSAHLARRDLAARRHLEADRVARAPVAARRGPRPRGDDRAGRPAIRRRLLRARPRGGARARPRRRRPVPARRDLRPPRRRAGAARRRDRRQRRARVLDQIADLRDAARDGDGPRRLAPERRRRRRPGRRRRRAARIALATSVAGLEGDTFGSDLERPPRPPGLARERRQPRRARRALAGGRAAASTTSSSSPSAPGMGAGLVLRGELHRGHNGAAGEVDFALVGLAQDVDPCAGAVSAFAARLVADADQPDGAHGAVRRARDLRRRARGATRSHARSSTRSRAGSRSTSSPSPPSPTSRSSSSAAASARTATSSSSPCARGSSGWIPYPPRVEVSSLGEAAVLTGALASGLRRALDDVVERRAA